MLNRDFKDKFELATLIDTLNFIKNSGHLIKKEISQMKILREKDDPEKIKEYCKRQNNIKMFFNNSRNMVEESIKVEKE